MEETRTVLRTPCPECDLSPRASGACVLLSGPGGFPLHLIGRCPQCSVTLGAWQSGPVAARPLSVAYPQNAELRSYRVYDVDEPSVHSPAVLPVACWCPTTAKLLLVWSKKYQGKFQFGLVCCVPGLPGLRFSLFVVSYPGKHPLVRRRG